jgi:hypothetical protein
MANERQVIRAAVSEIVRNAVDAEVFTSRNVDSREKDNFINVYFDSADVQFDGLKEFTTAQLIVAYHTSDVVTDDDVIDEVADAIHFALASHEIAPQLVQGFIPVGWEYQSDRESAFSGIYLRYTVTY